MIKTLYQKRRETAGKDPRSKVQELINALQHASNLADQLADDNTFEYKSSEADTFDELADTLDREQKQVEKILKSLGGK